VLERLTIRLHRIDRSRLLAAISESSDDAIRLSMVRKSGYHDQVRIAAGNPQPCRGMGADHFRINDATTKA
jgi:hypothetical protein